MSMANMEKSSSKDLFSRRTSTRNRNQNTETSASGTPSVHSDQTRSRLFTVANIEIIDKKSNVLNTSIKEKEERRNYRLEMTELVAIWDKHQHKIKEFNEAKIMQARWARYMKCDGSPDPVNQKEINTYISLRMESKSRNTADSVLNDSQLDLQLIEELKNQLLDSPLEILPEGDRIIYNKTIEDLQRLIMCKLDIATLQVACDATVMANKETGNLQYAVMIDDIALCVWGNIMKNPRIRSYEIPEIRFTFDIPRVIALTDCAVRVLTTKFDLYSPTSKSFFPRMKKTKEPEVLEVEPKEEKKEIEEEKEDGSKDQTLAENEDKEEVKVNIFTTTSSEVFGEETENLEEEDIDDKDDAMTGPPTPELIEWEDFDEDDDVVDLRAYNVLGSIFYFNLLQLPPQPKFVKSWTITQMVDPPEIHYLEYMADQSASHEESKETKRDERPPIAVSFGLPGDVLCLEQPQVARWDYGRKVWSTQGFSGLSFADDTMTINFKTTHFGTFCLLQDAHINMPFQSWEIRPHMINSAVFTITTQYIEIQIEIKDDLCCLTGPKNRPEIDSIREKWMRPTELIVTMKKAGVNIFPNEDSMKFVNIQNKHPLIEEGLYRQMAITASAMAYSWSKWNWKLLEKSEIIFQGTEALEDEAIPPEGWSTFMATRWRVIKLIPMDAEDSIDVIKEEKDTLSFIPDDIASVSRVSSRSSRQPGHLSRAPYIKSGASKRIKVKEGSKTSREQFLETFNVQKSQFKSNIYHLMPIFASESAISMVDNTSFQFVICVYKLLTATKILSYS